MSVAKTIFKNAGITFFGEVLGRVFSFFLIIIIARSLGDEGLGKYSFVFAFVSIFSIFSDLGLTPLVTREVAKFPERTKDFLANMLSVKMILATFSIVLPVIIIFFTPQGADVKISVIFAAVALFLFYIVSLLRAIINAHHKHVYFTIYYVIERIIAFFASIAVLYAGYGVIALIAVFAVSNLLSFFVLAYLFHTKLQKITISWNASFIKKYLIMALPFWFSLIFMTIYFRIDTIMIDFIKGHAQTGIYNASYKIIDSLSFIPFVVIPVVFPFMAKFFHEKSEMLTILLNKCFYYLLVLALPLAVGATMLADKVILLIYGDQFTDSIIVFQILAWALALIFINYPIGYFLNSTEKQKQFTLITGSSAVLNIILNIFLIPAYSYLGAAVATVITEAVIFIALFTTIRFQGYNLRIIRSSIRPLIATAAMIAALYFLKDFYIAISIVSGMLVYGLTLLVIGGIDKDTKNIVVSLINQKIKSEKDQH